MTLLTANRPALRTSPSLFATVARLFAVRRQRAVLKTLDDSRLADLGLTRAQALAESRRSLWDAPESWRC